MDADEPLDLRRGWLPPDGPGEARHRGFVDDYGDRHRLALVGRVLVVMRSCGESAAACGRTLPLGR